MRDREPGTLRGSRAPVTLRDLARRVGVHPSTISRVLSGDPAARLSEGTRARILELATATDYRPNRLARSLKLQQTRILGMLIPDVTNPFFSGLLRAVEDAAGAAGYNVILCNTDDSEARLAEHLRALVEGHVDGLLVATARRRDPLIEDLRARGMPYVLVNRRRDDPGDAWVIPDDRQGVRLAVEHLVRLGHRRIAHLAGAPDTSTTAARLAAFLRAMAEHRLPVDDRVVVTGGGFTETTGEQGMTRLLGLPAARRPTAVFAANDLSALGAIAAARAAGLRVPDDLSVVGYNDIPLARCIEPGLTTVRVPIYEMGRLAADILIRRLTGAPDADGGRDQVVLPVELAVRGSTARSRIHPAGRPTRTPSHPGAPPRRASPARRSSRR